MQITGDEIVQAIQNGDEDPTPYLNWLYQEHLEMVVGFVMNNQGTVDEGRDLLHEAIVRLYEQIYHRKISGISHVKGYLMTTCRNIWVNRKKREGKMVRTSVLDSELEPSTDQTPIEFLQQEETRSLVRQILSQLGKNCEQLLIWSDGEGRPMKWIAKELGYANQQVAMNAKSKCRKRLLEWARNNPEAFDLLS